MRIVIDARMYGLEHAGIGRYILNLINQIEKIDQKNEYYLLLRKKYYQTLNFKNKSFNKVLADYPHYSFKEQIFLPLQLIKLKPDLTHFPHFNVPLLWWGRQVVTIHDLIKHQSKGKATTTRTAWLYWLKYLVYNLVVWLAIKRAWRIITPCYWWKKELARIYKKEAKKILVTYEGVDEKFSQLTKDRSKKDLLDKYQLSQPFLIYTGSLYPHKNVSLLVEAVKEIPQLSLAVACARSVFWERFKKQVRKMKAEKQVHLLGFVPDQEVALLYQEAEAFVFPTLVEGFGLPGLEAMSVGLPVIASQIPVLKEVYGQAALFFDPLSVDDLVGKIKSLLNNNQLKSDLRDKGKKLVQGYSWQKMAQETIAVYQDQ